MSILLWSTTLIHRITAHKSCRRTIHSLSTSCRRAHKSKRRRLGLMLFNQSKTPKNTKKWNFSKCVKFPNFQKFDESANTYDHSLESLWSGPLTVQWWVPAMVQEHYKSVGNNKTNYHNPRHSRSRCYKYEHNLPRRQTNDYLVPRCSRTCNPNPCRLSTKHQ